MNDVNQCTLIPLPRFAHETGSLSFVEANVHIPFSFERMYYLYGLANGARRGAHAHKALHQFMIAISGSFDVILDDGRNHRRVHMAKPDQGLYICPMIWRDLENFTPDAVCVVLASDKYDEDDYYRNYDEFIGALTVS